MMIPLFQINLASSLFLREDFWKIYSEKVIFLNIGKFFHLRSQLWCQSWIFETSFGEDVVRLTCKKIMVLEVKTHISGTMSVILLIVG
jgi:hypothetical protein